MKEWLFYFLIDLELLVAGVVLAFMACRILSSI